MRQKIGPLTATGSGVVNAHYLDDLTFQFTATGISSGNGVLTVLGSNDGTNYTAIAFVDPTLANTNAQNPVRILNRTLNSNTSTIGVIENAYKFEYIKFTITITTDGSYSVYVHGNKKSG